MDWNKLTEEELKTGILNPENAERVFNELNKHPPEYSNQMSMVIAHDIVRRKLSGDHC